MKKYKKALRYLYKRYANTGYGSKAETFDSFKQKQSKMGISDLWRFRNDFLKDLVTKEELTALIRLVNNVILNTKSETRALDFKGFEHFVL